MTKYELFLEKIKECKVNLHGYILAEKGEILNEWYKQPFDAQYNHRMYSVSKSFVSLAIGILSDEGKIKLTDSICSYFPEYEPNEGFHPWLRETTIEDCLTMQSCHSKTTYKIFEDDDWVKTFFTVKPDHRPGCVFSYDTSAALVLGALVEKITGKNLLEFLREKCFDSIGFSKEAYLQKEPGGYSHAGSGLICTLPDMLKVAKLLMNKGRWGDKQLISEEYIGNATSFKVSTSLQGNLDESFGYGYYFWRTRKNSFCMYGMGGQLALIFPEKEMIFVCMADTQTTDGLGQLYNAFYEILY